MISLNENIDTILRNAAQIFAYNGNALEVAVLANSATSLEETGYDNGDSSIYYYSLVLKVKISLYIQIEENKEIIESNILERIRVIMSFSGHEKIASVIIIPELKKDEKWREKANAWLNGQNISNQGRVRSDNIATKACDGLLFRSEPEIFLYKALKGLEISFAPLPVFVRGGADYQRIEPDFVLIKDGIMMMLEVDGDTVHTETPAEAHARVTMLSHEGAHIEIVKASECDNMENAQRCAKRILAILEKIRASK